MARREADIGGAEIAEAHQRAAAKVDEAGAGFGVRFKGQPSAEAITIGGRCNGLFEIIIRERAVIASRKTTLDRKIREAGASILAVLNSVSGVSNVRPVASRIRTRASPPAPSTGKLVTLNGPEPTGCE